MKAASLTLDPLDVREAAQDSVFTTGYWLTHCQGFRVESAGGCLGYVEEVRKVGDRPVALAVRLVSLGGLLIVPVAEVATLAPRAERIVLKPSVRLAGSDLAARAEDIP